MFENRSLVCEATHDAAWMLEVGSVVEGGVRFEKTNVAVVAKRARWSQRLLSSESRLMKTKGGFLFAGLRTIRKRVLLRSPFQSMPALLKLAAKIVWPAPSLHRAGITRRSSGLASPAA